MQYFVSWTVKTKSSELDLDLTGPLSLANLLLQIKETLETGQGITSLVLCIVPED